MNQIERKEFLKIISLAAAGLLLKPSIFASNLSKNKLKAVVFDAFPVFDPRPIFKSVNDLYPDKGKQIVEIWQAKQFSYQWLRQAGNKYKNFWEVTKDALEFALAQSQIEADAQKVALIMNNYNTINVWSDVVGSLETLKQQGLKICFLSNMMEAMLDQGIKNAGIEKYFDHVISTDKEQTYKPSPAAYKMAVKTLKLKKEEILFVPFAGWDMAGAKWFGFPTFWVNRLNAATEKLDAEPDGIGNNLNDLVEFIKNHNNK